MDNLGNRITLPNISAPANTNKPNQVNSRGDSNQPAKPIVNSIDTKDLKETGKFASKVLPNEITPFPDKVDPRVAICDPIGGTMEEKELGKQTESSDAFAQKLEQAIEGKKPGPQIGVPNNIDKLPKPMKPLTEEQQELLINKWPQQGQGGKPISIDEERRHINIPNGIVDEAKPMKPLTPEQQELLIKKWPQR